MKSADSTGYKKTSSESSKPTPTATISTVRRKVSLEIDACPSNLGLLHKRRETMYNGPED